MDTSKFEYRHLFLRSFSTYQISQPYSMHSITETESVRGPHHLIMFIMRVCSFYHVRNSISARPVRVRLRASAHSNVLPSTREQMNEVRSPEETDRSGVCCTISNCALAQYKYHNLIPILYSRRGVGNERNLVQLVEKSVEIKLKSWEIKADFLEIKLGNQPNSSPAHFYNIWRHFWGKSKRNQEISYAKIARCRPLDSRSLACNSRIIWH